MGVDYINKYQNLLFWATLKPWNMKTMCAIGGAEWCSSLLPLQGSTVQILLRAFFQVLFIDFIITCVYCKIINIISTTMGWQPLNKQKMCGIGNVIKINSPVLSCIFWKKTMDLFTHGRLLTKQVGTSLGCILSLFVLSHIWDYNK